MGITFVFAGIPVADYDAALPWYERLVGRPPDMLPTAGEACWQLTETAWIYIVADADRAGRALVTLLVDDLDARVAGMAERGIDAGPIGTIPGPVRRTEVADPDGNRIQLAQPPGS